VSWLSLVVVLLCEFVTLWLSVRGWLRVKVWVLVSDRGCVAVWVALPLPAEEFTAVDPEPESRAAARPSLSESCPCDGPSAETALAGWAQAVPPSAAAAVPPPSSPKEIAAVLTASEARGLAKPVMRVLRGRCTSLLHPTYPRSLISNQKR
jgi:hypothetical protein